MTLQRQESCSLAFWEHGVSSSTIPAACTALLRNELEAMCRAAKTSVSAISTHLHSGLHRLGTTWRLSPKYIILWPSDADALCREVRSP